MKKLFVLAILIASTFTIVFASEKINQPVSTGTLVEECIMRGNEYPTKGVSTLYWIPFNVCPMGGCNPSSTCYNWSVTGTATISGPTNGPQVNVTFYGSGSYTLNCHYTLNGVDYSCTRSFM